MTCQKCGKYNSEDKEVCMHCGYNMKDLGSSAGEQKESLYQSDAWGESQKQNFLCNSKKGAGILACIFFGFVGLIVGLILCPRNTYERETFVKGWVKCFFIMITTLLTLTVTITLIVSCAS